MIIFWISAAALIALALLFVLVPLLWRRGGHGDPDRNALTLALFHQQQGELDADLAAGALERQQYQAARGDLERELLQDLGTDAAGQPAAGARGYPARADRGQRPAVDNGRRTAVLLAVLLPTAAVSLYLYLGNSALIPRLAATAATQVPAAHPPGSAGEVPSLEDMVQRLADRLEQQPDNLEGWMMLGRAYFALARPERALHALQRAYDLAPRDADVLVAYAEAIAANHGNALAGRPARLIRTALEIDPRHAGARWLAGLISFQAARYDQAAAQWEALLPTFDPESEQATELRRWIAEAHSRAGARSGSAPASGSGPEPAPDRTEATRTTPGTPPDNAAAVETESAVETENAVETEDAVETENAVETEGVVETEDAAQTEDAITPAAATAGVRVEVSLAEHLWLQADVRDTVFVYAKAVSGPPMPLAAYRARVADLPLTLTLDDSMAVVPDLRLSAFPQIIVGARIAGDGQAQPQSGDLEGEVSMVKPGQPGIVHVLIDRIRP